LSVLVGEGFLYGSKHAAYGGAKVIEFVVLLVRRSGRSARGLTAVFAGAAPTAASS
jgi:hypothetical protein